MIVKGEVKGVLETYHHSHLKADSEWLEFLEALAGQAAIAIDNAQLFENLQRVNITLEHTYWSNVQQNYSRPMQNWNMPTVPRMNSWQT